MVYNRLSKYATTIGRDSQGISVTYHSTIIVRTTWDHIVLNTGGWRSATTKKKMNQASQQFNLGYSVYQEKGDWFVSYRGQVLPFDGETLTLNRKEE